MKCKGIIAPEKGKVILTDLEVTDPLENEVQVCMVRTMISPGTERAHILALPNSNQNFPYVPGYCCAGYVEKAGASVSSFRKGDRVACFAVGTGHRQIGNVQIDRVARIPDEISFEQATFSGLAQTAMQGVRKCGIELGETVVVLGLGIVGQLTLQFARANGAVPAIGFDRIEKRLEIARACGADYALNNADTAISKLLASAGQNSPNVVLDSTGFPSALAEACACAANYARVCLVGCPRGVTEFDFYHLVQLKSIRLIGAHAVFSVPAKASYPQFWTFTDDIACFFRLLKRKDIRLEPLVSDRISWRDTLSAYEALLGWNKDSLAVIINWETA